MIKVREKKKNVKKEDKNFQKHITNLEKQITWQLVKNLIHLSKKSNKRLAKIKMIKILKHRNQRNKKSVDAEEKNGIRHIMNSRIKLQCLLISLRFFYRMKKNRLKMINNLQKSKNKRNQKSADKDVENGTKYTMNQEK